MFALRAIALSSVQHAAEEEELCCNVLQCVAACCSVLQCVAVCCSVLQYILTKSNCSLECASSLQHFATLYYTLQHTTTRTQSNCLVKCAACNTLQHTVTHCNTLQHTAKLCNTLQHTATHCNTLQHTATRTQSNCLVKCAACGRRGGAKFYCSNRSGE